MVKKQTSETKYTYLSKDQLQDIRNLFSNSMYGNIQDRKQLRDLLDDEDSLIDTISSIHNERDTLLIESVELNKKIKRLEKDVSKGNK